MAHHKFKQVFISFLGMAMLAQTADIHALGLMASYEAALANDPAYRAALHENEAGQQFRVLGRANLLPTLSASYSRNKNRADIVTSSALGDISERRNYNSLAATIQLRQPVYHPEGMARFRQGLAQTQASNAQLSVRSQDLILRVFSLYTAAKYTEDQLSLALIRREAYTEQRTANLRLFQSGEGTRTDVLETQAKFDLSLAQVIEANDNVVNARNALAALVGQEVDVLDRLTDDFKVRPTQPDGFDAWKTMALERNPEIIAQRHAVEVAGEDVNKNRAGHSPRLDLVLSAGKNKSDTINTFNQNADVLSVGVQLNIPLYTGGSVAAATSQAVAYYEKAQAELDAKTIQILVELRKQYNLTLSSSARLDAASAALQSASMLVEGTQKSVKGGQRTNLDVLNAQQQLFDARRELSQARYSYLLSVLRLRSAAGVLGVEDLKEMAVYFVTER